MPRPLPSVCTHPAPRPAAWFGCLVLLCGLSLAPPATAQSKPAATPVYLWGFQAGCERQEQSTKHVADWLSTQHVPVQFLRSPSEKPLPACPGAAYGSSIGCMDALKAQCPATTGSVIGGLIEKGKQGMRTRLWLLDLASGQRAVRDDYCQQCDPILDNVLAAHVALLLQNPPWQPALSSQPSYCRSQTVQQSPRGGRLYLGLFGTGASAALGPGPELRNQLVGRLTLKRAATGLEPPQLVTERAPPERIAAGSSGSQVLLIEKSDSGRATLTLWDQSSGRLGSRSVPCAATCLEPVTQAAAELLDTCFAAGCAELQSAEVRPPSACEPLSDAVCPALPSGADGQGQTGTLLSAGQATTIMALVGTGLGLSVATSVGLWIANERVILLTDAGSFNRLLTPAAAAVTALSVGLVGLSVPAFVWLDRHRRSVSAGRRPDTAIAGGGATPGTSPLLLCPGATPPSEPAFTPTTARTARSRGEE